MALRRESASVRLNLEKTVLSDQIRADGNALQVLDTGVLKNIEAASPVLWPSTSVEEVHFLKLTTIPVNTAVIIAHVLDLTNTELVIDPAVTKLYIIAEQVTCGPGAQITWARPGGSTPAALDNPDLNGRGWSGVQTKPNSRDGLDGESGRAGSSGIDGARGHNAPDLEMWVKAMTAVPNLDLNGEDGRQGGRGQRGGSGGHGGDGHVGERIWFFGWHCTGDPGDGGDGGNGGDGGPGGRGGNGANGGQITIGVLKGTLATTVTNQSFKIKDQGGQKGPGGDGGPGGSGGGGGRSGVGETCTDAHAGHNGAQGQPGRRGTDGSAPGLDGEISFFEFTEDAWDELLTRPWLSQIVPTKAFPGDVMTLHGSRFTAQDRVVLEGVSLAPTVNADESISVTIPVSTGGGEKSVTVRRDDGTESNRLAVWIKPQLDAFSTGLTPNATHQPDGPRVSERGIGAGGRGGRADDVREPDEHQVHGAGDGRRRVGRRHLDGAGAEPGRAGEQRPHGDAAAHPGDPVPVGDQQPAVPELHGRGAGLGHVRRHIRSGRGVARAARPGVRAPDPDGGVLPVLQIFPEGQSQRRPGDGVLHVAGERGDGQAVEGRERHAHADQGGAAEDADGGARKAVEPRIAAALPRSIARGAGPGGARRRARSRRRSCAARTGRTRRCCSTSPRARCGTRGISTGWAIRTA